MAIRDKDVIASLVKIIKLDPVVSIDVLDGATLSIRFLSGKEIESPITFNQEPVEFPEYGDVFEEIHEKIRAVDQKFNDITPTVITETIDPAPIIEEIISKFDFDSIISERLDEVKKTLQESVMDFTRLPVPEVPLFSHEALDEDDVRKIVQELIKKIPPVKSVPVAEFEKLKKKVEAFSIIEEKPSFDLEIRNHHLIMTFDDGSEKIVGKISSEKPKIVAAQGDPGKRGLSAYEIAVKHGFTGTEQQWLDSLGSASPQPGTIEYDAAGLVEKVTVGDSVTLFHRDAEGTITSVEKELYTQQFIRNEAGSIIGWQILNN